MSVNIELRSDVYTPANLLPVGVDLGPSAIKIMKLRDTVFFYGLFASLSERLSSRFPLSSWSNQEARDGCDLSSRQFQLPEHFLALGHLLRECVQQVRERARPSCLGCVGFVYTLSCYALYAVLFLRGGYLS